MAKVIAAFNMTLNGVSDHTAGVADAELHEHYAALIRQAGLLLYGRTTFELMSFWQGLVAHPSGEKAMDDFAIAMDRIPKLIFSKTLNQTGWASAALAERPLMEEVASRRLQEGPDILVGSKSLIIQLLVAGLIDELQLCIHPVIEAKGDLLFAAIKGRIMLRLVHTKVLGSGAVVLHYVPTS